MGDDSSSVDCNKKPRPSSVHNWSYRNTRSWQTDYAKCMDSPSSHQSPINIDTKLAVFKEIPLFVLSKYDTTERIHMELLNNGFTAKIVYDGTPIEISGGGLPGSFRLANIHFHWGDTSASGSEHRVDGRTYPMEMHMVHFNSMYADVKAASCQPNGLAVLAFFYEIVSTPNPAYDEIITNLANITLPGFRTNLTTIPLESLLPSDLQLFYRYDGSLTTPGCNEGVIWTVFKTPVQISEEQIACFRSLKSSDFDNETKSNFPLVNNTRPTQNLNDRVVYASFTPTRLLTKKRGFLKMCPCLRGAD